SSRSWVPDHDRGLPNRHLTTEPPNRLAVAGGGGRGRDAGGRGWHRCDCRRRAHRPTATAAGGDDTPATGTDRADAHASAHIARSEHTRDSVAYSARLLAGRLQSSTG